jgi:hypothetical protein
MSQDDFAVNYDYTSPFARNVNEHVLAAIAAGTPYQVAFRPFSLRLAKSANVAHEAPDFRTLALSSVVARDHHDRFPAVHRALFALVQSGDEVDDMALSRLLAECGMEPADVLRELKDGWAYDHVRAAHADQAKNHSVFGTPTFFVDGEAAFVRVMVRPDGDGARSKRVVAEILEIFRDRPYLNEFKRVVPYARLIELKQRGLIRDEDFGAQLSALQRAAAASTVSGWREAGVRV